RQGGEAADCQWDAGEGAHREMPRGRRPGGVPRAVDGEVVTMVDRARDGMSAMARSTALTCAAFARWVAAGKVQFVGVVPPEKLATDDAAYQFILDTLRVRGIAFDPPYPFVRPQ